MRRNERRPGERLEAKSRTTMHSIDAIQAADRGVQLAELLPWAWRPPQRQQAA
jgi:hypothetical protein